MVAAAGCVEPEAMTRVSGSDTNEPGAIKGDISVRAEERQ